LKGRISEKGQNIVILCHPWHHDIPFIDVHGRTNALKDRMSEKGLNIKKADIAISLQKVNMR
jgi:hypothetical protein